MRSRETWEDLEDFPGYAVSTHGRVMNKSTEMIKVASENQQGILSVNLIRDHIQNRRSVALLVAGTFLPVPANPRFDTPIHLDGNRFNCRADNLDWRPLWFARKYHSQFHEPVRDDWRGVVEIVETGEVFDDVRACSTKYGLLEKEIINSAHTSTPVFPHMYTFRLVSH